MFCLFVPKRINDEKVFMRLENYKLGLLINFYVSF